MSLLSYEELWALVARGVIKDVHPDHINAASIDITLGRTILVETIEDYKSHRTISLSDREPLLMKEHDCADGFVLHPGQFILAQSQEKFFLPNDISAEYKLKSSMARVGINHCLAGWCDAGWTNSVLTLELMNVTKHHSIQLKAGDKIGQMVFFSHRPVPDDKSYATRGSYNNDEKVQGAKNV